MKNLLFLLILTLLSINLQSYATTKTVKTIIPTANSGYETQLYSKDLCAVEDWLFGTTYKKESIDSRLKRIERRLFNANYTNLDYTQRMNNIIANYRNDYNRNYLTDTYGRTPTTAQRILNRFIGQPTGYTPPIVNTPFNDYGYPIGINRSYSGNRGYGFNNYIPANMGAGIHILD